MNRRAAFTLTEMLMTISLTVTAGMIAGRLFFASMRTMAVNGEAANAQVAADHAGSVLRRDIWSASRIERVTADELRLSTPDLKEVTWTIRDAVLARSASSMVQHWPCDDLRFAADPAGVLIQDSQGRPQRLFVSPFQAQRVKP